METCFSQEENCTAQDISVEVTCSSNDMEKRKTVSKLTDNLAVNNNIEVHEMENDPKHEVKNKCDDNSLVISIEKHQKGGKETLAEKCTEERQQNGGKETLAEKSTEERQQNGGKETSAEKSTEEKVVKNRKSQIGNIVMTSLKDRLVRHRFIGPESQKILSRTLYVADIISSSEGSSHWWEQFYQDKRHSLEFSQQREFWNGVAQCQSAAELCPQSVIGLTVRDPRVIRSHTHSDVAHTGKESDHIPTVM
jgi:hypothetical protein